MSTKVKRIPRPNLDNAVDNLNMCMNVYHSDCVNLPPNFKERHDELITALLDIALFAARKERDKILPRLP